MISGILLSQLAFFYSCSLNSDIFVCELELEMCKTQVEKGDASQLTVIAERMKSIKSIFRDFS